MAIAIAGCLTKTCQDGTTQKCQVVQAIFELHDDFTANLANILGLEQLGDARVMLTHPRVQALFGTLDDRVYGPQRVVQIQGDGANVVHVLPAAH